MVKGNKMKLDENAKKCYDIFAKEMDKRDKYLKLLREFYAKHKFIPDASEEFSSIEHHRQSFEAHRIEGFKPWRQQPKVVKRLKKAAKKASKAKGLEKLIEEQKLTMDDILKISEGKK